MRNKIIILFFLLLLSTTLAQNQNRKVISLDGSWLFTVDSTNEGAKQNWQKGIPDQISREVQVPHTWNIEPGLEEYAGLTWYQKKINIPNEWKGKNIRLKFNAVYHDAVVYVDGKKAGENLNSGYTPFTIDITPFVKYNSSNTIVVSVNNSYSESLLPYKKSFDWVNDGGIIRSVSMIINEKPSLRYVHIAPILNLHDSTGIVNISIKIWEPDVNKAKFKFVFKEKKSKRIIKSETRNLQLADNVFSTSFQLGKIKPWHFDFPNLYTLETYVIKDGNVSDNETSTFGFKELELKGSKLYLNGEEVRLPGIEYMASSNPNFGAAEPRSVMDSAVHAMKDLNVCITRFHWQQDDYLLDLMDKYGILVQEEIPWWQQPANLTPVLMKIDQKQLSDMINAHYNHPCIFSWGLSNEVNGGTKKETIYSLRDFAKSLDSTRLVTVVSNKMWKRKGDDESLLCDLPTWNEYIGTWHAKSRTQLPAKFDIVKKTIGDRPLLITENGFCEPAFAGGDARRIDDMFYHINEWRKRPYVIGFIYFCLNDYRTHMGEEGFGKFKIRRHGVMDLYLKPKPSYYVLKQIASPIEITKIKRVGNSNAEIEFRVKNTIPSYTIRSYRIQYYTDNKELKEISLPELKPGDTFSTQLNNINSRFAFKILNPNGFMVAQY